MKKDDNRLAIVNRLQSPYGTDTNMQNLIQVLSKKSHFQPETGFKPVNIPHV